MYDNEGNYVILPDPDTVPEAGYEAMSVDTRNKYLDGWWSNHYDDLRWYEENTRWWD